MRSFLLFALAFAIIATLAQAQPLSAPNCPNMDTATVGTLFSSQCTATGGSGPDTWSLGAGSPPGLSIGANTGLIGGFPTASGEYQFTVTVRDSEIPPALKSNTYFMVVGQITCAPTSGTVGVAFAGTCSVQGASPGAVFSFFGDNLPPGLNMNANGAITGTPTQAGQEFATITASGPYPDPFVTLVTFTISVPVVAQLTGVNCNPSAFTAPGSTSCDVGLNNPAPKGGIMVSLSSNNNVLTVPQTVMVQAGQLEGAFTATAISVSGPTTVTITATYLGVTQTFTIQLTPAPPTVQSLQCAPLTLSTGKVTTCTVTLSFAALAGGATVGLFTTSTLLPVPASIIIPAGSQSGNFTATAGTISTASTATLTANYNGSQTAVIQLSPSAVTIQSLQCDKNVLSTSTVANCTVTLSAPAPAGGAALTVQSSNAVLSISGPTTIAAGQTTTVFQVNAGTISAAGTATITVTYNGSFATSNFQLTPSLPTVNGLSCSSPVVFGTAGTCTVFLSSAAPSGGVSIALSSTNSSQLSVPNSLTVTAGLSSETFTITAGNVPSAASVTVTAAFNGSSASATIQVLPAFTITCNPVGLNSGQATTCAITLSTPAPAGGATVTLTSNFPAQLPVPGSLNFGPGATVVSFSTTAANVTGNISVTILAIYNGFSQTTTIQLLATPVTVAGVACSPATLTSGQSTACFVTLSASASSAVSVTLSSSSSTLTVPGTATVPAGSSNGGFTATAGSAGSATITASAAGTSKTTTLTINPPPTLGQNSSSSLPNQTNLMITFGQASANYSGTLSLSFTPNPIAGTLPAGYFDPSAGFPVSGSSTTAQTTTFTVPANTPTQVAVPFAVGTVAGTWTVNLTKLADANGNSFTPSPTPSTGVVVGVAAPVIESGKVSIVNAASVCITQCVQITACSNTRSLTSATFQFTAASGASLGGTQSLQFDGVDQSQWFGQQNSQQYGGCFSLLVPFSVSGSSSSVSSVSVTLTNSAGTSAAVSGQ